MNDSSTSPHQGADARLCRAIRGLGHLRAFPRKLHEAQRLMLLIDDCKHDRELDDAMLAQLDGWHNDYATDLWHAARVCQEALAKLKAARDSVSGLFKGQVKDESEEMLARTIKLVEQRTNQLRATAEGFQPPKVPHEIRRTTLIALMKTCQEVEAELQAVLQETGDASHDFLASFTWCLTQLGKLHEHLSVLRTRCTQKTGRLLEYCILLIGEVQTRMSQVERESARRGDMLLWYPDLA